MSSCWAGSTSEEPIFIGPRWNITLLSPLKEECSSHLREYLRFSRIMMTESPMHPNYEKSYYDAYGFDLQEDFSQFLEEAKRHGKEAKLKSSSVYPEEAQKKGTEKEKKAKKSWRTSLISWWKADKKGNLEKEPPKDSQAKVSGKRQVHVSGPIYNTGKGIDAKHRRTISGPLTSLFKATKGKGVENEIDVPYMSLSQQNSTGKVQSFGPIYKVA
ncbi:hypothetical protein L6164_004133 [Bauhinia variegata]|uniref:Uncharacterized protein n=1 Tax=Bauhinia variegata TaxID=167791 RepID=A0ACB9Q5P6_BAUVA|nr:hypothetical protein L6164_004133 [Bauhinia variegata]